MSLIIVFTNITELKPVSDYIYKVLVGDGTPERSTIITYGKVSGHRRSDGWKELVRQLLNEAD